MFTKDVAILILLEVGSFPLTVAVLQGLLALVKGLL